MSIASMLNNLRLEYAHRRALREIVANYFANNKYSLEDVVASEDVVKIFIAFTYVPGVAQANKKDLSGSPQSIFAFVEKGMTRPTWKAFIDYVQN